MSRLIVILFMLLPGLVMSQQFLTAGPDKETCEGKPVQIGPPDSNPNLCYRWEPETNLSCSDCPNPIATVETDAEYTLYITDDDFSLGFDDKMLIDVVFGNITFNSSYVKQGSNQPVTATLNQHDGSPIIWDFEGDDFGCVIASSGANTASIAPGDRYGKLTVIAINGEDAECKASEEIEVNVGVKDIEVSDADNPGRVAKQGETLYVISNIAVKAKAIPNSGETFTPPANPDWHYVDGNSIVPPDGIIEYEHDPAQDGDASFTAGFGAPEFKPTTYVNERIYTDQSFPASNILPTFSQLSTKLNEKANFKSPAPIPAPQLTVEIDLGSTALKRSTVENYNDPDWDWKYDFTLQSSIKITGEAFHPVLTKSFAWPSIFGGDTVVATKLSLAAIGTISISGGFVKDPSQMNSDWTVNSTLSADASLTMRVQASITLDFGEVWNATAVGSASAKAGVKFTWNTASPDNLVATPYANPLVAEVDMYLQRRINPKKKRTLFPKQTWELIPKFTADPYIFPLANFFN